MTIPTVYIHAKSKKLINRLLDEGQKVWATQYTPTGTKDFQLPIDDLPDGTVIKVYARRIGGTPYAHAYGNWNAKKKRVK